MWSGKNSTLFRLTGLLSEFLVNCQIKQNVVALKPISQLLLPYKFQQIKGLKLILQKKKNVIVPNSFLNCVWLNLQNPRFLLLNAFL
jgi:hypothetical protein